MQTGLEGYELLEGDAEVHCAGVQAVQLGHNLDAASAVVMTGLPWSCSALSQLEARVHRLTATRPVSVYAVLTRGSLDERKWELPPKKGAASDQALDGQLVGAQERPIDWNIGGSSAVGSPAPGFPAAGRRFRAMAGEPPATAGRCHAVRAPGCTG
jgi:hypothetical protein